MPAKPTTPTRPTRPTPPPLTPRFQRVLALDRMPFGWPQPTPEEIEAIRGVLAEGVPAAQRVNLARAMSVAADKAPDAETARLIAKILKSPSADVSLRRRAAAVLGDIPVRGASKALTEALATSTAALEATLLKSLAKVGDLEAARVIAARAPSGSVQVARLRDFARAAILYRLGGAVDEAAERALVPVGVAIEVSHASVADVEAAVRQFRGSTYGLRFNPELGYAMQCGTVRHLVLLSAELQRGKLLAALAEQRRIVGIVAMQEERGAARYLARRLIVTRPQRDGIDVSVVSPAGEVDLLGTLRPDGDGYALALRSHGATPRPTAVDGFVSNDGLVLHVRAFFGGPSRKLGGEVDPAVA